MELFEKRLRSRSSQVQIVFGKSTLSDLREILVEKIAGDNNFKRLITNEVDNGCVGKLVRRVHNLGYSVGWFTRVLSVALSLALTDAELNNNNNNNNIGKISINKQNMISAFLALGVDVTGYSSGPLTSTVGDPRLQTLLQLPAPGLLLLICVKRLNQRDILREEAYECATFERCWAEYEAFRKKGGGSNMVVYGKATLFQSWLGLVEGGLLRIAADHTGIGPLQVSEAVRECH